MDCGLWTVDLGLQASQLGIKHGLVIKNGTTGSSPEVHSVVRSLQSLFFTG